MGDEPTKRCSTCREVKPLGAFNRLKKAKDGRQYNCRDCNKQYHYENWDRHMSQIRRRGTARKAENKRFIVEYLLTHPCVDCGETDILVLEFDHVNGDKSDSVGRLVATQQLDRVIEEIQKCEVVCCNCHRRRTARRSASWYRIDLLAEDGDDGSGNPPE